MSLDGWEPHSPGIDKKKKKYLVTEEQPPTREGDPHPQFGDQTQFHYDQPGRKRDRRFWVDFQMEDDTAQKPQKTNVPWTPLDPNVYDGRFRTKDPGYGMYQPEFLKREKPKSFLRSQLDYADMYDQMETSMTASKKANQTWHRVRGVGFGDWVVVVRPYKYGINSSMGDRVGVVSQSMGNGWHVMKNLRGKYIPIFSGNSSIDSDVTRVDFEELMRQTKMSAVMPSPLLKRLVNILKAVSTNVVDTPAPAIDETKQNYLHENYLEEGS
jgi:hypothetical protein